MLTIVGIAIIESIIDPVKAVSPVGRENNFWTMGAKIIIPIKPITTLGIAAKNSIPIFKNSFVFPEATSAINIAQDTPRGKAITAAPIVTVRDPRIRERISNLGGWDIGCQFFPNIKSIGETILNTEIPSFNRKKNIKATKIIEVNPDILIRVSIIHSHILLENIFLNISLKSKRCFYKFYFTGTKSISLTIF
jgi:hypothetical protein